MSDYDDNDYRDNGGSWIIMMIMTNTIVIMIIKVVTIRQIILVMIIIKVSVIITKSQGC